jgi:hypothetical protein
MNTMHSSLEHAIQLNNEGVALLVAGGQDQKAVSSLTRSLTLVMQQVCSNPNLSSRNSPCCDYEYMHTSCVFPSQTGLFHHLQEDSVGFIYNRPLTISSCYPKGPETIPICSASIILNLALAYHRRGKQAAGNLILMNSAEKMYKMVLKLLPGPSMVDNITASSIRLIAINNLARLYHYHDRYCEARETVECLSTLIRHAGGNRDLFNEQDLHFFICNVMVLLLWTPPPVAAAA